MSHVFLTLMLVPALMGCGGAASGGSYTVKSGSTRNAGAAKANLDGSFARGLNAATMNLSNSLQQSYEQQQNAPATTTQCYPDGLGGMRCTHTNSYGVQKSVTQCYPDGLGGVRCTESTY
jgi:hypothetical protein